MALVRLLSPSGLSRAPRATAGRPPPTSVKKRVDAQMDGMGWDGMGADAPFLDDAAATLRLRIIVISIDDLSTSLTDGVARRERRARDEGMASHHLAATVFQTPDNLPEMPVGMMMQAETEASTTSNIAAAGIVLTTTPPARLALLIFFCLPLSCYLSHLLDAEASVRCGGRPVMQVRRRTGTAGFLASTVVSESRGTKVSSGLAVQMQADADAGPGRIQGYSCSQGFMTEADDGIARCSLQHRESSIAVSKGYSQERSTQQSLPLHQDVAHAAGELSVGTAQIKATPLLRLFCLYNVNARIDRRRPRQQSAVGLR
ncbi:hypothetical protein CCMA1212_001759 [Trichoderma ghanense]|uniref:Uncharacterized protein n=1 Tax=Trichoderma ghanense TaxID=65468 RepID=A0ABY2HF03_9HYPO